MSVLSPLCREYQVDWLLEKMEDCINDGTYYVTKESTLKNLLLFEEMNFGPCDKLINTIKDDFPSIHMSVDFMALSSKVQVMIARKRMWLLLRGFDKESRKMLLNEEDCGFLSIFEDQSVFDFEYNDTEEIYIRKFRKPVNQ